MFSFKFKMCRSSRFPNPFQFLAASLRRDQSALKKACHFPLLDLCNMYGAFVGLLGMGVCLYDMLKIVQGGRTLPCSFYRGKIDLHIKCLTPEHERDCKLINLVLSFQSYALLVAGSTMRNPYLFLPWLALYALVIAGDMTVVTIQLFKEGIDFEKRFLISSIVLIYNWLAIFCMFVHMNVGR
ncbi:hypothetical protein PPYR_12921 [Photinus pyralis]|uniref:Uncharacterized protein n=1 Tax=Photinus pyralis TaxID=7054 RepID=A0A5N4A7J8_PHOPY|nr:uncharacterized protein LOC116178435 [Photinus pyralis]XP_031355119.1 uncharacterized protein LOC116179467 [Photinus pyralis]KAB0793301.1 hypothetical protein PPYR_12921 [Photinus pyralis]